MKTNWLLPILIFFLSSGILTGQDAQQTAPAEQKLSATSKYDFIPGESLMFFDDFTRITLVISRLYGTLMVRARLSQLIFFPADGLNLVLVRHLFLQQKRYFPIISLLNLIYSYTRS